MADDDIDELRAERDEWRRRAELAEAVSTERLARAETAERALRAAEVALAGRGSPPATPTPAPAQAGGAPTAADQPAAGERRPASLLERWRRYTETIN